MNGKECVWEYMKINDWQVSRRSNIISYLTCNNDNILKLL